MSFGQKKRSGGRNWIRTWRIVAGGRLKTKYVYGRACFDRFRYESTEGRGERGKETDIDRDGEKKKINTQCGDGVRAENGKRASLAHRSGEPYITRNSKAENESESALCGIHTYLPVSVTTGWKYPRKVGQCRGTWKLRFRNPSSTEPRRRHSQSR